MPKTLPTKSSENRPGHSNDALSAYIDSHQRMDGHEPAPLVSTAYTIAIDGGFADVTAERRFRNAESRSIEAMLTFPVPVQGVLYGLEARIGERVLKGVAQPRSAARETYEDALDRGKTTVLHEELIPGVHMLSVGHVPPGAEITVTARWAMSLAAAGGRAQLRIPLTVGDIYGTSPLQDVDDLQGDGSAQMASLRVTARSGRILLHGKPMAAAEVQHPTDAPIDLELVEATFQTLDGRTADGREVHMLIAPAPERDTPIEAAILVDHSGSMSSPASAEGPAASKHSAVLLGLAAAAGSLRQGDCIRLWEFDDTARDLGEARDGEQLRALLTYLSPPAGGTEIGSALRAAVVRPTRDVILVTDGKSHALNVQELARTGCRFTVVLVGEDSLEANVGHLAALTGGAILVALGADVASAVTAAIACVRSAAAERRAALPGIIPEEWVTLRSGMRIGTSWGKPRADTRRSDAEHAVAAFAANLLLPGLTEKAATELAIAEGLVGHLTSLVLVDEAGITQEGLAATRKVRLPAPRTAPARARAAPPSVGMRFALGLSPAMSHSISPAEPPGLQIFAQTLWLDPCGSQGWSSTAGLQFTFRP